MTRINVVPVSELCDQHLLAEHREITRVPNFLMRHAGPLNVSSALDYTLGAGHVRFFYSRCLFLAKRYDRIFNECRRREFLVNYNWPLAAAQEVPGMLWGDYKPTPEAMRVNRERIALRMPLSPRFTKGCQRV